MSNLRNFDPFVKTKSAFCTLYPTKRLATKEKMSLADYFTKLILKVEQSEHISNAGKDKDGFYKPTRTILLRNLQLLKDLHNKPRAQAMVIAAWNAVVTEVPPEWLKLDPADKKELSAILSISNLDATDT